MTVKNLRRKVECQYMKCVDITEKTDLPLAMAYIPMQKWRDIYDPEVALERGTVFAELDKPWLGKEAVCDE